MTKLSTTTQAVLDAFSNATINSQCGSRLALAAALRAAADQVVPESIVYIPTSDGTMRRVDELWIVRRGVYAIAAELEGQ